MSPEFAVNICKKAIQTILMCSAPMLIAGMVTGLVISILQAATQVNEQTLSFIPKIVAVLIAMLIFGPWIIQIMVTFTTALLQELANL